VSDRLRQDGKTEKLPLTAYLGIDGKLHSIRKAALRGQQVTGSKIFVNEGRDADVGARPRLRHPLPRPEDHNTLPRTLVPSPDVSPILHYGLCLEEILAPKRIQNDYFTRSVPAIRVTI